MIEILKELLTKFDEIIVFTGAGISYDYPTALPLGDGLIKAYLSAIKSENEQVRKLRPEVVLQAFYDIFGEPALKPLARFRKALPNRIHLFIDLLARRGFISRVLTTNLDLCHEKSRPVGANYEINHLHGGADDPASIKYALSQVADRKNSEHLESCLGSLGKNTLVIFLGYSGKDEFDIAQILGRCEAHFLWIQHAPGESRLLTVNEIHGQTPDYILEHKDASKWTFVRIGTWEFCRELAVALNIAEVFEGLEKSIKITNVSLERDTIMEQFKRNIKRCLGGLYGYEKELIESRLLWRYVDPQDAIRILSIIPRSKLSRSHQAQLLMILGGAYFRVGGNENYKKAKYSFEQLNKITHLPKSISRWQVLRSLGIVEGRLREFLLARNHYKEALSSSIGNDERGMIYGDFAATEHLAGKRDKALKLYKKGDALLLSDPYLQATLWNNIGELLLETGSYDEAETYFNKCLNKRESLNHREGLAVVHLDLGELHRIRYLEYSNADDRIQARDHYDLALCYAKTNQGNVLAKVLRGIGDFFLDNNELERARNKYEEARAINMNLGYPAEKFSWLLSIFELQYLKGADYEQLKAILKETDNIPNEYKGKAEKEWLKILISLMEGKAVSGSALHPTQRHRIMQMRKVVLPHRT